MRKKTTKYAVNGALILGTTNALLEILNQLNNNPPGHKIQWKKVAKSGGKGLVVGAVGGGILGAIADDQNIKEKLLNTSLLLNGMLKDIGLQKDSFEYLQLSSKADEIVTLIKSDMQSKLGKEPTRIGSTEDGTALHENFDIDIAFEFKNNGFTSTSEMFNYLNEFVKNNYVDDDLIKIRRQSKSIGLIFNIEGKELKIDLVPTKLSNDNLSSYLTVNSNSIFAKNTHTKTNISQLKNLKLTTAQKRILVILKIWKSDNSVKISSTLLKMMILDAYKKNSKKIPRDFTKKLIMVFSHIEENILYRKIKSIENTNNVLTDMSIDDKRAIQKACKNVIQEYQYQPNSILDQFNYN